MKYFCILELINQCSIFGAQPPIKTFFSRDDELNQIHKHVCETNDSGKSITVLTGMSGVGKTQIARKYVEIYNEYFEGVVWVDAALVKIQLSLTKLCQELGLTVIGLKDDAFDIDAVLKKIQDYFENKKTLYIFDNVDDESIKNFKKFVSIIPKAYTLITSQLKSWAADVNQVQINPFSHQDAFLFMKRNVKEIFSKDDEKLKEITEVLIHHPLLINKAILYINISSVSLQEYLDLLRSYPIEILEEDFPTEAETKSAITLINLVLDKIETSNEKSLEI